ncbi:MAG: peroxiredoxin [Alphaproteobacteria bacterium]
MLGRRTDRALGHATYRHTAATADTRLRYIGHAGPRGHYRRGPCTIAGTPNIDFGPESALPGLKKTRHPGRPSLTSGEGGSDGDPRAPKGRHAGPRFAPRPGQGWQNRSQNFRGQTLVLYFYPKDDSGCARLDRLLTGCKGFRQGGCKGRRRFEDGVAAHDKFVGKHSLKVTLGSDPDGAACEAYGVWTKKSMYGRTYMGIERSPEPCLIDDEGRIARVWRKVKVPGHVDEVLEAAQELAS